MPFTQTKTITESAYTLVAEDHHLALVFPQACTVLVPAALTDDFACGWEQSGEEQITFVAGEGVTFTSRTGRNTSRDEGSIGGIHAMGDTFRLIGI